MTPELTKALELAGREHLLQLAFDLGRVKQEVTNKHAAQGSLRSGAYVGSLLSVQLDALTRYADAVVQDYARLAVTAGATTVDDVAALKTGITGLLSGKGFLDSLRELVARIGVPEAAIIEHAERSLEALRGRALLRLEELLADESVILEALMADRVTIRKRNGQAFENVPAAVRSNLVVVERTDIPIEPGDAVIRRTNAGVDECFVVEDPSVRAAFAGIHARYQLRVHRADTPGTTHDRENRPRAVIYQVHGPHARFNLNSVDSSTNVVTQAPAEMFATLREAIAAGVQDETARAELLETAEAMEAEVGGPGFTSMYARFVALAADHMQVLEPFIPALTQMLMSGLR